MGVLDDQTRLDAIRGLMSVIATRWAMVSVEERQILASRLQRSFLWLVLTIELDGGEAAEHQYVGFVRDLTRLAAVRSIPLTRR